MSKLLSDEQIIDRLIAYKKAPEPFYATPTTIKTDMDMFPYQRFFRGEFESDKAIILEREAGWRPRHDNAYQIPITVDSKSYYPNHAFQAAPSTTYPYYPEYMRKYSDKRQMESQLYRKDVLEYR